MVCCSTLLLNRLLIDPLPSSFNRKNVNLEASHASATDMNSHVGLHLPLKASNAHAEFARRLRLFVRPMDTCSASLKLASKHHIYPSQTAASWSINSICPHKVAFTFLVELFANDGETMCHVCLWNAWIECDALARCVPTRLHVGRPARLRVKGEGGALHAKAPQAPNLTHVQCLCLIAFALRLALCYLYAQAQWILQTTGPLQLGSPRIGRPCAA